MMSHPDLDRLWDALLPLAQQMLAQRGRFAPFASSMNADGEIAAVDARAFGEPRSSREFVDSMTAGLERQAAAGQLRAAGICCEMHLIRPVFFQYTPVRIERLHSSGIWCDVRDVLPGATKSCRAIRASLEHSSGEAADVFLPYKKPWFGKTQYREPIPLPRAPRIFLQTGDGEIFDLADGQGVIDIRGNDFDSMLLVDGKPIALNWSDCGGSIEQYMVRAGATDCEDRLRSLRHVLEGNLRRDEPIKSQILPFLALFAPGRYQLRYRELLPDCNYRQFDGAWNGLTDFDHFYPPGFSFDPYGAALVFTQAIDALNQDRVEHYLDCLRKGRRPIALTAAVEEGWCDFVLDGHHKLQAYKLAKINPTFISVRRLGAPPLPASTFEQYFDSRHPLAKHYFDEKTNRTVGKSEA